MLQLPAMSQGQCCGRYIDVFLKVLKCIKFIQQSVYLFPPPVFASGIDLAFSQFGCLHRYSV